MNRLEIRTILFIIIDCGLVLLATIIVAIYFGAKKSRKENIPLWSKASQRLVVNLAIPLVAGGLFCVLLFLYGYLKLIAAGTLIFYGMALLNAGKYTVKEIRIVGIIQIVLGLICGFFPGYGLIYWSLGFGLVHILYGTLMYMRYEMNTTPKNTEG